MPSIEHDQIDTNHHQWCMHFSKYRILLFWSLFRIFISFCSEKIFGIFYQDKSLGKIEMLIRFGVRFILLIFSEILLIIDYFWTFFHFFRVSIFVEKIFQKKELPLGNIESRDQWKSINTRSILSKAALRGLEKGSTNKNEEYIHQARKRGCQSKNINQDLYYRNSQGCSNSIGKLICCIYKTGSPNITSSRPIILV